MNNIQQIDQEAPIIQKTADLYKEFYGYLKLFPKQDQYLLGKRCEDYLLDFLEQIYEAVSAPKEKQRAILVLGSAKFEVLKFLLRSCRDLRMIDNKKYLSLESKIQDIGKQLGGWIRSLNLKTT